MANGDFSHFKKLDSNLNDTNIRFLEGFGVGPLEYPWFTVSSGPYNPAGFYVNDSIFPYLSNETLRSNMGISSLFFDTEATVLASDQANTKVITLGDLRNEFLEVGTYVIDSVILPESEETKIDWTDSWEVADLVVKNLGSRFDDSEDYIWSEVKDAVDEVTEHYENKIEDLEDQLEQMRVQMAGISVVASGCTSGPNLAKEGDYGWSIPYQDVLKLRQKYDDIEGEFDDSDSYDEDGILRGSIIEPTNTSKFSLRAVYDHPYFDEIKRLQNKFETSNIVDSSQAIYDLSYRQIQDLAPASCVPTRTDSDYVVSSEYDEENKMLNYTIEYSPIARILEMNIEVKPLSAYRSNLTELPKDEMKFDMELKNDLEYFKGCLGKAQSTGELIVTAVQTNRGTSVNYDDPVIKK